MNWEIAFFIWLKGVCLFITGCILLVFYDMLKGSDFLLLCLGILMIVVASIAAVVVASLISCPAIALYALSLHLMKKAHMGYKTGIISMIIITAPLAVGIVDFILYQFGTNVEDLFSFFFWIPLLFCIASILISRKSISLYLYRDEHIKALLIK